MDGVVNGDVIASDEDASSIVVISKNARVNGKVKAGHVIIAAEAFGPLHCAELLRLQLKARAIGDIRYELPEI